MKYASIAAAAALAASSAAADVTVGVDDSTAPWIGFMNVFNLDNSAAFSSGWGVPDLRAEFDDANSLVTMLPNTINDPDPFWYIGGGGPGAAGNKIMEANLFQQVTNDAAFSGQTVTFEGFVVADTLTAAHEAKIFIRDFAPDFSSFNETIIDAELGAFSLSLATDAGPDRHVQWGFQLTGVNVWVTDVLPFGSISYSSVPAPGTAALLGLAGLAARRRR